MQDFYNGIEIHPAISQINSIWMRQIERAKRVKEDVFGYNAREMMGFYNGPKSWDDLMGRDYIAKQEFPDLAFRMTVNKVFEFVTLFGPSLFQINPVRTVKPRAPVQVDPAFFADPVQFQQLAMMEQSRVAIDGLRSILIGAYLNWTPSRYNLDVESRQAIEEALIKGRGLLWTELTESPDKKFRSVVSRFDSIDHLVIDPDASSLLDAKWIAQRCIQPLWQVEREYGIHRNALKGNLESMTIQADIGQDEEIAHRRRQGTSADLLTFWKVWSKMGIGGRVIGVDPNTRTPLDEMFGDYCYVVVCNTSRFPLNLPPDMIADPNRFEDCQNAAKWPIPYYADGRWPFTELDFHRLPNLPWPMAHCISARGELKFLNWVFSFLAGHIRNASRDFVAVQKSLSEEIKSAIISGRDLEIIELEKDHGLISDCIQFLQHPQVNGDIWKYIDAVMTAFDKRVGLSELLYGADPNSSQPRSAAESNIRNEVAGIRPDDMASQVEAWQANVATMEAFAARYLLTGKDVSVALGPLAANSWDQWVFTLDMTEAFHALEYRIESGSTRRPNKQYAVRQMSDAMTVLSPLFQAYAQTTGDCRPLNNLVSDYCKAQDLDPSRYQMMAAPLPPQLPAAAPGEPDAGGDTSIPPASGQQQLG